MKNSRHNDNSSFEELSRTLPPVIARKDVGKYLGGIISRGYLANLDSKGQGPPRIKIGKNVGYIRASLVEWLRSRCTDCTGKKGENL